MERPSCRGKKRFKETLERFFIVRISWVFGKNGNNFVKTMLRLAETHAEVNVVCDQIGSPTYTADLRPLLCDMIATEKYGVYHATNEGLCSWAEFAEEIFRCGGGKQVKVNAIPTEQYPTKAIRPKNSRMSKSCLDLAGISSLADWKDALGDIGRSFLRMNQKIVARVRNCLGGLSCPGRSSLLDWRRPVPLS